MQRDQQLRHAPIKWTSEDLLHVTLAFLGEVKGPGISDVIKVASKPLRCEPVDVELVSVGVFPPSGLARVHFLGSIACEWPNTKSPASRALGATLYPWIVQPTEAIFSAPHGWSGPRRDSR